mmetsp:Transcript_99178/g.258566  ORF Transcript_99178/g.258566 Transcript_99178/m.258566 type:complete len:261 (+) Transcript_99178:881-1663(+)
MPKGPCGGACSWAASGGSALRPRLVAGCTGPKSGSMPAMWTPLRSRRRAPGPQPSCAPSVDLDTSRGAGPSEVCCQPGVPGRLPAALALSRASSSAASSASSSRSLPMVSRSISGRFLASPPLPASTARLAETEAGSIAYSSLKSLSATPPAPPCLRLISEDCSRRSRVPRCRRWMACVFFWILFCSAMLRSCSTMLLFTSASTAPTSPWVFSAYLSSASRTCSKSQIDLSSARFLEWRDSATELSCSLWFLNFVFSSLK